MRDTQEPIENPFGLAKVLTPPVTLPPVPVRSGPVRSGPPPRPSLRRSGLTVAARIWPDQEEWARQNEVSYGLVLRVAIDAIRGEKSPFSVELSLAEENAARAAQFAIYRNLQARVDWLERRATQIEKLRVKCAYHVERMSRPDSRALVVWVRSQLWRYNTLRDCRPEDVAEELGHEL